MDAAAAVTNAGMRPPTHAAITTGTTSASASVAVLALSRNGTSTNAIAMTTPIPTSTPPRRPNGRRERRLQPCSPDHGGPARRAVLPDPVVSGDDQGLPDGGRRVHGDARQLWVAACTGCRRRAADRLRAHRLCVRRRGHGRLDVS